MKKETKKKKKHSSSEGYVMSVRRNGTAQKDEILLCMILD